MEQLELTKHKKGLSSIRYLKYFATKLNLAIHVVPYNGSAGRN